LPHTYRINQMLNTSLQLECAHALGFDSEAQMNGHAAWIAKQSR